MTTTILNSSAISFMKDEICFISLSTDPSEPVLRSVVMARVAIDLVWTFCGGCVLCWLAVILYVPYIPCLCTRMLHLSVSYFSRCRLQHERFSTIGEGKHKRLPELILILIL